jgi:peptide/nickel transport system ATP-binding protein
MKPDTLKVANLRVQFDQRHGSSKTVLAVEDVSFEMGESEIVSIVGESGSGKTTLARCIAGLTHVTSGSIKYGGTEVRSLRGKDLVQYRREVQIVFQDPFGSLNPRHDVFTAISTPLRRLNGENSSSQLADKVQGLLREVGLEPNEVIRRYPHQLSGGQRQRVNIARALAPNPKLLIADEPITMLDAAQRLNIISLLSELNTKRKIAILLITHDLASAKILSHRILVMYLGRLVEEGPMEDVLSKPHHPYVRLILEATPSMQKQMGVLTNTSTALIEESMGVQNGCVFRPRCKYATSICNEVVPNLEEKSPSHQAACHNPLNI